MPSISVTNPESIVSMNLGDASPKLGGVVNLSRFRVLRSFYGDQQDLSGFQNYSTTTTFTVVHLHKNKLTGDVPDFSNSSSCTTVLLNENNLDGSLPSVLPSGIQVFRAGNNNLLKSDSHLIPDLRNYTNLAEFNIANQSALYGVDASVPAGGWSGPGQLANDAIITATGIEGAIPESIRIFNYAKGNLSKDHKRILLTQLYDTFGAKPAGWAISTPVNGITYSTPKISVNNSRGKHTGNLIGKHFAITISAAQTALGNVGFTLQGF
jgi:hypothetical protein